MKRNILIGFLLVAALMLFALPALASPQPEQKGFEIPPSWLVGGLVVNAGALSALYKNFRTIFQQAFDAAKPQWQEIAMDIPSNAENEVYVWLEAWPKMREWLGDRVIANLKASDWTVKNKDWESTVAVPRNKIMFDTYGIFKPMFKAMGAAARNHPDEIVFSLLNNGFTNKCYDGKNFFDTTHGFGSNKGTGVLNPTNFGLAVAAIGRIKDAQGKPLFSGTETLKLVTGPELRSAALEICNSQYTAVASAGMKDNVWKGAATPMWSPQITSATAWFIVVDFNGLLPIVFQTAKQPEFVAKEDPNSSDHVFMRKEYVYGVDSIDNAGYGLPQLAYGSDGSV